MIVDIRTGFLTYLSVESVSSGGLAGIDLRQPPAVFEPAPSPEPRPPEPEDRRPKAGDGLATREAGVL